MSETFDPRGGKSARNERLKLTATTFNTIGLTAFGVGVLTPLLTGVLTSRSSIGLAFGVVVLYILHRIARSVLLKLED